jgi:RNA polymerase sigma-70 factor (ECF subfamily)
LALPTDKADSRTHPAASDLHKDSRERFGELVHDHQSQVRAYISSLGVANSSVDDIAQEAFLVAFHNFEKYQEGTSFPAWVTTIARHLIYNDGRKTRRRYQLLNETLTEAVLSRDASEELAEEEDETIMRSIMTECIDALPVESQDMLRTRYFKGLKTTDMAEQFKLEANTIRQRLLRIREAMRRCIESKLSGYANDH